MFTMWWAYFDHSVADHLTSKKRTFIWGYGHFFIFVSIAALGAGLAAAVDVIAHKAEVSSELVAYFIAISLVVYSGCLWFLQDIYHLSGFIQYRLPSY